MLSYSNFKHESIKNERMMGAHALNSTYVRELLIKSIGLCNMSPYLAVRSLWASSSSSTSSSSLIDGKVREGCAPCPFSDSLDSASYLGYMQITQSYVIEISNEFYLSSLSSILSDSQGVLSNCKKI